MNEKPILFNGEMVRAILGGRKTQTRRVVKDQGRVPTVLQSDGNRPKHVPDWFTDYCPYGGHGDRLWVRETHWRAEGEGTGGKVRFLQYKATSPDDPPLGDRWRPSIHMPRWASRITLEVVEVRMQRVQDITDEDAIAEGVQYVVDDFARCGDGTMDSCEQVALGLDHRRTFSLLWDDLNTKRGYGWDTNPWVWAVTFKRLEGEQ